MDFRRGWLFLAVLPMVGGWELRAQSAAPALTEGGAAAGGAARVTFRYENQQLQPAKYTLMIHESGSGEFHSEPGGTAIPDTASYSPLAQPLTRPIQLTPAVAGRVFAVARREKFFAVGCEDTRDKVAFQGAKQLSYEGPDGSGSCSYNWSKLGEIQKLTVTLESIAFTLEEGRRLELEHKHDRLALDAELEMLR
jgi:hypothetical protein